jgi:hypothetical protein
VVEKAARGPISIGTGRGLMTGHASC